MHKIESHHIAIEIEPYPFGKRFAIALVDDTDHARVEESQVAYQVLRDHGVRSTRTVWPLRCDPSAPGAELYSSTHTLEDPDLRTHCTELAADGFEIAMHTASGASNSRNRTLAAYELFEQTFGHPPVTNVMHSRNLENMYWGSDLVPRRPWQTLIRLAGSTRFHGHDPGSEYFWGDICQEKTRYVRHLDSLGTNSLGLEPATPFHDPNMPFVNWWFNSTYGAGTRFFEIITPESIQHLRRERGASIVHCYLRHYARRSEAGIEPHPRFIQAMEFLSSQPDGWYVPVAELLDRLRAIRSLRLNAEDGALKIRNESDVPLSQLAIRILHTQKNTDHSRTHTRNEVNSFSQANLGDLAPGEECTYFTGDKTIQIRSRFSPQPSYSRLAAGMVSRIAWQVQHGRRYRVGRSQKHAEPPWVRHLEKEMTKSASVPSFDTEQKRSPEA